MEIYDIDSAGAPQLGNISTRGFVDTGENVMIGGVIVGGSDYPGSLDTVVRALGPSLTAAGISDPLADPMLELHDADGNVIAANDDWKEGDPDELTALGLAPSDDHESAIVMSLPAGQFTAIASGKSSGSGVALIEIYNVDTATIPGAAN